MPSRPRGTSPSSASACKDAHFPEIKTLDTFDFAAAAGINATQVHTLARGEWVTAPENVIFAGPIGTGKTHCGHCARRGSDEAETPRPSSRARPTSCDSSWKPAIPASSRGSSSGSCASTS